MENKETPKTGLINNGYFKLTPLEVASNFFKANNLEVGENVKKELAELLNDTALRIWSLYGSIQAEDKEGIVPPLTFESLTHHESSVSQFPYFTKPN